MRTIAMRSNIEPVSGLPVLPAPDLDVERCLLHNREYPIWLPCPECRVEIERLARAEHFTRRMKQGENLLRLVDVETAFDGEEGRAKPVAVLVFWLFYLGGLA